MGNRLHLVKKDLSWPIKALNKSQITINLYKLICGDGKTKKTVVKHIKYIYIYIYIYIYGKNILFHKWF